MKGTNKMKKQYLIYADESHRKGQFFSNFYGGALIDYQKLESLNDALNKKRPNWLYFKR